MYDFHQLAAVNFQYVAVFSRPKTDAPSDIMPNASGDGADQGKDARAWSRFTKLGLSDQARKIEKCLITLVQANDATHPASVALRAAKASKLIILIRPEAKGRLHLDRLCMTEMTPAGGHLRAQARPLDPTAKTFNRRDRER